MNPAPPQPLEPVELAGERLMLRPWLAADADDVLAACQDAELQRYIPVPVPYEREHAESYVAECPDRWAAGEPSWAVVDRFGGSGGPGGPGGPGGRVLGAYGFVRGPFEDGVREVGYWVAPWARGQGVATAATRLACRWAFETLGTPRVEWQAEVGNIASRRVAEKAGFVMEGILRSRLSIRGERRDGWIAGLLPGELR